MMCTIANAGHTVTTHSSFGWALRQLAWLPSSEGSLTKGCDLCNAASAEVTQLLQRHVLYLHANIKNADMLSWLGIRSQVTASSLLTALKQWSQQDSFNTNLLHMSQVYERLSREMASDAAIAAAACTAFTAHSLIWLPAKVSAAAAADMSHTSGLRDADDDWQQRQSSRGKDVVGRFYGIADKLSFRDHTHVIEDSPASPMRALIKYYNSDVLHQLFLQQLHHLPGSLDLSAAMPMPAVWGGQQSFAPVVQPIVPVYPSTADYCDLLASLAEQPEANTTCVAQAMQVMLHWAGLIGRSYMPLEDAEYLRAALGGRQLLPTMSTKWVAASEGLYVLDDEDVAAAFEEKPVHFLWLPESMQPSPSR